MRVLFSPTGVLVLLLLTSLPARPLGYAQRVTAQEQAEGDQPEEAKVSLSGEIKIFNDLVIPQGEVRSGNIRVIGGNLTVAGRVTGRITVLGGDVDLQPTAQVEGSIVALGGKINRSDEAQVTGDVLEVNRGKVSVTREESRQIFGYDEDKDERLDWHRDEDEDDEWVARDVGSERLVWRPYARRRTQPDFELTGGGDLLLRYNRAEGVALYIPFHPDTDDIPGFEVYGFGGRAFKAQQWYGRIGIGEYLWRGRIGFLVEGHKEPRHNDGWRVTPKENSLGAFLIHQDWYDFYEAEGYGGSFVLGLPPLVEFKARYRNEIHAIMDSVTNWSLFREDRFRGRYPITEGRDVNLQYLVTLGWPVGSFPRRFQGNLSYAYTKTMDGSAFDYTRDDITLEAFVPLHRRLGIRVKARTGAVYGDATGYGLQHLVPIGGIGSLQGYDYKELIGNQYAVVNAMFSLRKRRGTRNGLLSLHWHFGLAWDSQDRILTGNYFSDLQKDGCHAVGISMGNDDARIELFRPLVEGRDWIFYLRILDF